MAWVKLDDQFADHPKVAEAGPLAAWLHVKALVYCGRYLTDGFVPAAVAHSLVDWAAFGVTVDTGGNAFAGSCDTPTNAGLAATLVDVGLWDEAPNGYQIHDYLDWNPSAQTVKAEREAERQRKAEARSKQGRDASGRVTSGPRPANVPPVVRPDTARNPDGVPPVPSPSPSPSPTHPTGECERRENPPTPPLSERAERVATALREHSDLFGALTGSEVEPFVRRIDRELGNIEPVAVWRDLESEVAGWVTHARKKREGRAWSPTQTLGEVESFARTRCRERNGKAREERERERAAKKPEARGTDDSHEIKMALDLQRSEAKRRGHGGPTALGDLLAPIAANGVKP